MSFYHSPEQIDSMTSTTDTYQNAKLPVPQRVTDVKKPSDKIIFGEWLSKLIMIKVGGAGKENEIFFSLMGRLAY